MPKNTNNLRIAFVVDDGMDKPDGVQQYILTLGEYFKSKGHNVRYLAGETKRTDIKEVLPISKNLKVRFNGNSLSTPFPASRTKIKRLLDKEKFDVIHVQMPYSPVMAGRVVHLAKNHTKIIGTFHILPLGETQYGGTKLLGYVLKRNLKKFDKFLSVSPPAREFAKQSFGIESDVLPNPVDIKKFRRSAKREAGPINIVYLGRLVPRKGCMQLLKALDLLLEKDASLNVRLHICGDGNQRHKLEHFVKNSRLREYVRFHGFVSEKEKVRFLNNADIAVFPSISGESFGIVLIEAMAAGAGVVIAGNNPGYASVMHEVKECLFDPKDPVSLSDKLESLISDTKQFISIHKKQQELVRSFDINVIGEKLLKIYTGAK